MTPRAAARRRGRSPTRAAGLVLSATSATLAWPASGGPAAGARVQRASLTPPTAGGWPALEAALRRWGEQAGALALRVALLPPLVELRGVALPPASVPDARRLLARSAARHFLHAGEPLAFGVSRGAEVAESPPGHRLAAAVPERLLHAIHAAATAAGFEVSMVLPAVVAAGAGVASGHSGRHAVLMACADQVELLGWQGGNPVSLRLFRSDDDAAVVAHECSAIGGPVLLLADHVIGERFRPALAAAGVPVRTDTPRPAAAPSRSGAAAGDGATPNDVDVVAATVAQLLSAAPLDGADAPLAIADGASVPGRSVGGWRGRLAAALLLGLAAAATYRVGLQRELDAVRARRVALQPALAARGLRPGDPGAGWRALADSARSAVPWADVLGALATALPDDAHLRALRAHGDTVELEGIATDAAEAFRALDAAAPGAVDAVAPVRRERTPDGLLEEHFHFRVRLHAGVAR